MDVSDSGEGGHNGDGLNLKMEPPAGVFVACF